MTKQFGTPGPRAIHPELCDSPSLGRCGLLANSLFPRLIAQADDQGRLVGDAYSLLVNCMGRLLRIVAASDLDEAVVELVAAGVLQRYEADGQEYVQLSAWWRWQSGQRRAYPSRWPAPAGWTDLVYGCAASPHASFEEALSASSRRNAATRGVPPQSAAGRGETPPRAQAHVQARTQAPVRAHAVPDRAPTMPSPPAREGAANGAAPRSAMRESAQRILDDPNASEEAKQGASALLEMRQ